MCLIAGVVSRDPAQPVPPTLLRAMARRIGGGGEPVCAVRGSVGFVHRMGAGRFESAEDAWVVADVDLTNLAELQSLAGSDRHEGGLLIGLHRVHGAGLVDQLRGAFALAIWSPRARRLLLAVDRFGIKRLYYTTTPNGFAFASRPSALLVVPGMASQVDPGAAYLYLNFGFVPAPHSIFAGIRRLPPGHTLLLEQGQPRIARYWNLAYPERSAPLREAADATYRMVEEAVAGSLHGAAAKETGAFLSGGTDSSTVLGLMAKVTGERVHAFSIGFREPRYDELHYATLAARHFDAAHETAILTAEAALADLPRLVEAHDEPFGNDSSLATYACARLARDCGMTRLLAGDGGDELFGGNERYRIHQMFAAYQWIPGGLRRGLLEPLLRRLPQGGVSPLGRAQRYVRRANLAAPRRFYHSEFFVAREGSRLLTPEFARLVDLEASWKLVEHHFESVQASSELNRLLSVDLKLTIGDNDLLKVTRAAELAGVGVRFPMLDHRLAEFTGTLPTQYKVRGLQTRYLFKRAFRGLLPAATLTKRKHGFGVPVSDWLKSDRGFRELSRDTLLSAGARIRAYVRADWIDQLVGLHEADTTSYYGSLLWMFLMFELWHRQHASVGAAA